MVTKTKTILMRNVMSITALFCSAFLYPKNLSDTTDQLIDKMCLDLKDNESLNDSLKLESINQKFILPYLAQFTDSERQDKFDQIYFRLQNRCQSFRDYLQKNDPPKTDDWVRLNEHPAITVSENEINLFKKNTTFHYFEYGGEKTTVQTDKSFWKESFADGSYSKLFYKWIGKNRFELEFIESNNNGRKNFSKKGDRYMYQIINKEDNFYWILVESPTEIVKFKLFIEN